jgi:signal transduction histidine kinase
VDRTVTTVLSLVTNTLPLRSAILLQEAAGRARIAAWHAPDMTAEEIREAATHATTSYAYLTGAVFAKGGTIGSAIGERAVKAESKTKRRDFIIIPLVVDHQPIFGVLQLETLTHLNEADLAFATALAHQLAVAVDRYNVRRKEVVARAYAEAAERRMRFLAEASRLFAASLDYVSTWETVAQLAVGTIADLCILDSAGDEPFSRATLSPDLAGLITENEAAAAFAKIVSGVLRTGRSVLYPESSQRQTKESLQSDELEVTGESATLFKSYICVPLRSHQRSVGAITLVATRSGDDYTPEDLVLLEDLARRTALAFQNAQLYAAALGAIQVRDDVIAIVAHDLKAPLTVISGFVNVFLKTGASEERITCDRRHLTAIQRSAKTMNRLIESVLDTSRIEASHLPVDRQPCPVAPLVATALELLESTAAGKGLELKSEVSSDIAPVFADRDRIIQVFSNLIGNAIKFSERGGTITVRAEQLEKEVRFSIQDTGRGIPENELPKIFDRYWQAPVIQRRGTGLGLFIVRGIVKDHGGKVWAHSHAGVGSTFFFTLPLAHFNKGHTRE